MTENELFPPLPPIHYPQLTAEQNEYLQLSRDNLTTAVHEQRIVQLFPNAINPDNILNSFTELQRHSDRLYNLMNDDLSLGRQCSWVSEWK